MWKLLAALVAAVLLLAIGGRVFLSGCDYPDRRILARVQTQSLGSKVVTFYQDTGRFPASLEVLAVPGADGLGPYARSQELRDPWGAPFHYRASSSKKSFILFTLGSDGLLGGAGDTADQQFACPRMAANN